MNDFAFADLKIGQNAGYSVLVKEEMMDTFCNMTGDINPLHSDKEYAKNHGFQDKVCFGFLTASFLSTLAGVYLPGKKCLIQSVEVKFANPVYVGDELKVTGTVIELNVSVQQIVLKVEIRNQKEIKVLRGKMKVGFTDDRE